ncbi:MAG: alpha/beta fold hydrolase [Planctomycetes bacterium]|nr:alpha/beta fold hydrolase [Planctomycetota bacterium]
MNEPVVTYLERGDNEAQTASLGKMQHLQPRLWAREFANQGESRGALAVMHDHGEHGGRYSKLGGRLADNGWAVSVFDFRSHGDSDGDRSGAWNSYEDPLQDLDMAMLHVAILMPEAPRVAVGTGLGGIVAMAYAAKYPENCSAFVAFNPDLKSGPAVKKPGIFGSILGGGVLGIEAKDRFRDPKAAADFANDKKITLKRDGKTANAIEELRKAAIAGAAGLKARGFIVISKNDKIADPAATRDYISRTGGKVELLETDLGHAVFHDAEAETALVPMIAFLDKHFPRGANKVPRL